MLPDSAVAVLIVLAIIGAWTVVDYLVDKWRMRDGTWVTSYMAECSGCHQEVHTDDWAAHVCPADYVTAAVSAVSSAVDSSTLSTARQEATSVYTGPTSAIQDREEFAAWGERSTRD